jgi:hypothetical protein
MTRPHDDPIADAILSDDPEERLRYVDWAVLGRFSLSTKLRALGIVSGSVGLVLLAFVAVRRAALRSVLGTAPLSASVSSSVVLAGGMKFLTIGFAGLVLVGVARYRGVRSIRHAERLFSMEATATVLGLGVLVGTFLFVILATTGPDATSNWIASLADPIAVPASYGVVLWWSIGLAVCCFVASFVCPDRS